MASSQTVDGLAGGLAAPRLWAASRFPYFAAGLFALRPVAQPGLGTMAVDDRWRLYYDPAVVSGWSTAECGSVLVHEVLHLLRDHAGRATAVGVGHGSAGAWNLAADAEINDDLRDARLPLPGEPVLPSTLGAPTGRLAEEYFARLRPGRSKRSGWECGSGAHGVERPFEAAGAEGDADGFEGVSRVDADIIRRVAARDIAIAAAAEPGSVPGGLARWADRLLAPRVDWRRELATAIRRGAAQISGRVDYSYRRRSRRAAAMPGLVLPGLIRPVPEVAVVCDTSGSMGSAELGACLTEIEGIIAGIGARRVAVLSVDCEVQATARVNRAGQISLRGGGGTDMGEGIAAAVALRPRPQVVVVLTDGYTPWPPAPPPATRVIVGLIGAGPQTQGPPWARSIRIGEPA